MFLVEVAFDMLGYQQQAWYEFATLEEVNAALPMLWSTYAVGCGIRNVPAYEGAVRPDSLPYERFDNWRTLRVSTPDTRPEYWPQR